MLLLVYFGEEVVDSLQDERSVNIGLLRAAKGFTTYLDRQICCAADGEVLDLVAFDHYVLHGHVVCMRSTYV